MKALNTLSATDCILELSRLYLTKHDNTIINEY